MSRGFALLPAPWLNFLRPHLSAFNFLELFFTCCLVCVLVTLSLCLQRHCSGAAGVTLIALSSQSFPQVHARTLKTSMASGTFKLPASGSLAMPFLSPHGDSPPAFIDRDAERVTSIALQSQGAAATAVFESDQQLPRITKLLPVEDLLRLSAEELGAKMAAASPELSVHRAAFVSAGFCGAVVCSYASVTDSDFEQLLMDVGIGDTGHRQRLI